MGRIGVEMADEPGLYVRRGRTEVGQMWRWLTSTWKSVGVGQRAEMADSILYICVGGTEVGQGGDG